MKNTLRHHRKRKGLTMLQVANHLGSDHRSIVYRWERGGVTPGAPTLKRLAELYGVPMEELLMGE